MLQRFGVVCFWVSVILGALHAATVLALFPLGHPAAANYAWQWLPVDIAVIAFGISARYIFGWTKTPS